jgi:hypothetical protein
VKDKRKIRETVHKEGVSIEMKARRKSITKVKLTFLLGKIVTFL